MMRKNPLQIFLLASLLCLFAFAQDDVNNGECGANDASCSKKAVKEKAFFDTYANPMNQARMILDKPRTEAYRDAMIKNPDIFKGATVIDVGCGSGILSLFAAKAGAKRVFCVEYTSIVHITKQLVAANGFSDIISVVQGKMEDVDLPVEKGSVDIIISEWMGYFGIFEGMFRSVLWARDNWMRKDGHVLPDKVSLFIGMAQAKTVSTNKRFAKWDEEMFGLNLSPMKPVLEHWHKFEAEGKEKEWRSGTYPEIIQLKSKQMLSAPIKIATIDLQTASVEEFENIRLDYTFKVTKTGQFDRVAGWFNVEFTRGGHRVVLDTSPSVAATHWMQMVFHLDSPRPVEKKQRVTGMVDIVTRGQFHREMKVVLQYKTNVDDTPHRKHYTVVIIPDTSNWAT